VSDFHPCKITNSKINNIRIYYKRIKMNDNKKIGETKINNRGSKMTIIEYKNYHNIIVNFDEQDYSVKSTYKQFEIGGIKSPYDKTVFGHGYIGIGNYNVKKGEKYSNKKSYTAWVEMLRRCYYEKSQERFPTYKDCTVCSEWYNYQNFARWFEENYYEIEGELMCLDKDILVKGNKVYSPDTCIFAPSTINSIFTKRNSKRGDYPIGVTYHKKDKKYVSKCNCGRKIAIEIGRFNSPIAF